MENPILQQAIGEIRFKPAFGFHKYRFDLGEMFQEKLPNWNVNWKILELYDQKEKEKSKKFFALTNNQLSLLYKDVGDYENFRSLGQYLFGNTISKLNVLTLGRFGVRLFFLYKINDTFETLSTLLIKKLFCDNYHGIFSKDYSSFDLASVMTFKQKSNNFRVTIGPLSTKEISQTFQVESSEPAILVDLDCYIEEAATSQYIKSFLGSAHNEILSVLHRIEKYIIE